MNLYPCLPGIWPLSTELLGSQKCPMVSAPSLRIPESPITGRLPKVR